MTHFVGAAASFLMGWALTGIVFDPQARALLIALLPSFCLYLTATYLTRKLTSSWLFLVLPLGACFFFYSEHGEGNWLSLYAGIAFLMFGLAYVASILYSIRFYKSKL